MKDKSLLISQLGKSMKNKLILLIFISLVFAGQLFSIGLNNKDLLRLEDAIKKNIPKDSLVYLKCKNDEINTELIPFLVGENYKVLEKSHQNNFLIEINVSNQNVTDFKKILFFKTKNNLTKVNVICKITEPEYSRIIYYKKFQYTKKITKNATNWYEPALITTIVGGLAYLFYFGTN